MPPEFQYDVFISYSSRDKAWVRDELLPRIEQTGLKAFIDFRDFTRGAPSIKEMERGVKICRKTLLVLTQNYIESGWCDLESVMAQTLDPSNRDLRLIPLLKTDCKKPLYVAALTHIDFTDGADLDLAWRQLFTALGKPPELEPPPQPERDGWYLAHPYPMPPNSTGRATERDMLTKWLTNDATHPLLVLRALGGFGKSALSWHWLTHDVPPATFPRVVWWSFYEVDASFDHFLSASLDRLGIKQDPDRPLSQHDLVERLLELLHAPGTLLVLDGFERALRAFSGLNAAYQGDELLQSATRDPQTENDRDCISLHSERFLRHLATLPGIQSKVLLTTRFCPRVLEARGGTLLQGCRDEELNQMQPADAVAFFQAKGIRGLRSEIGAACAPYGYHPLSLNLLSGLIMNDFEQPGDIAAAQHLDVSGDLIQRQHHVLEAAYNSLTPQRQAILSRIACFRSPVKYDTLKTLSGVGFQQKVRRDKNGKIKQPAAPKTFFLSTTNLDEDLRDLMVRGLLQHDKKTGKFDLHPIVRRYAYDRLTTPDRTTAHIQLIYYFAAVPQPEKVTRLEDLTSVIELYHHTVRAGRFDEAFYIMRERLHNVAYFQFGASQLIINLLCALFPNGDINPPRLTKENAKAWTLNSLANSYSLSGQPRQAMPLFKRQIAIREKLKDTKNVAVGLENLAHMAQFPIGAFKSAETNLNRGIYLGRVVRSEFRRAIEILELGRLLTYIGAYNESDIKFVKALKLFENLGHIQAMGGTWAYRALRELFIVRAGIDFVTNSPQFAIDYALRAFKLSDEAARTKYAYERDYIRAHWLLGAAYRGDHQFYVADHNLIEALERCRRINNVEHEADILIDLSRLRAATGSPDEAWRFAEEALLITERCGYVLQGADAHLELAKLALARDDKSAALEHATEARRLATCDGPPDYTYKVAYDEAGALLTQLAMH